MSVLRSNSMSGREPEIYVIKDYNNGGGYDWATVQLGLGRGKTWIRYGTGCSCDSIAGVEWAPLTSASQIHSKMLDVLDTKDRIAAIPVLMDWLPGSANRTIKNYAKDNSDNKTFLKAMLNHEESDTETRAFIALLLGGDKDNKGE